MSQQLTPCPFCGATAKWLTGRVGCEPCDVWARNERIWNRRVTPQWVSVDHRLPEEREQPYQVIVAAVKQHDQKSMYAGLNQRRFLQDWVVRRWPQNFTHWMEAMPWPKEPA